MQIVVRGGSPYPESPRRARSNAPARALLALSVAEISDIEIWLPTCFTVETINFVARTTDSQRGLKTSTLVGFSHLFTVCHAEKTVGTGSTNSGHWSFER